MSKSVKTYTEFLRSLYILKPKFRKALLKSCNDEEIKCICECIYNVLRGGVPIPEKEKDKLQKYKNVLRKIISKGKDKCRKRIIIQKGGAFLPIILGSVLSALLGTIIK